MHGNIDQASVTAEFVETKSPTFRLPNIMPQDLRQLNANDRMKLLTSLHLKHCIDKQCQLYILGQDGLEVECLYLSVSWI